MVDSSSAVVELKAAGARCTLTILVSPLTHTYLPTTSLSGQAVREEGGYANGRVHVELLPTEVYGAACEKQFSLRRLEVVLTEAEQQEHLAKELLKVRPGVGQAGGQGGTCGLLPLPPLLLLLLCCCCCC